MAQTLKLAGADQVQGVQALTANWA